MNRLTNGFKIFRGPPPLRPLRLCARLSWEQNVHPSSARVPLSQQAPGSRIFPLHRRLVALLAALFLLQIGARAQIQQAWAVHYNNGITNGQHQAVKMAMDSMGNIYVCGFSEDASSNLGYATIKYAPSGNQLWVARASWTNMNQAKPTSLALDASNAVVITGNGGTVKYDANGQQLWTAPYAGLAIACDANENVIVTGYDDQFGTVKLSPGGSVLWQQTLVDVGPTISQAVVTDSAGNVYVSGSDANNCNSSPCYVQLLLVKYNKQGARQWKATPPTGELATAVQVAGMAISPSSSLYILNNYSGGDQITS